MHTDFSSSLFVLFNSWEETITANGMWCTPEELHQRLNEFSLFWHAWHRQGGSFLASLSKMRVRPWKPWHSNSKYQRVRLNVEITKNIGWTYLHNKTRFHSHCVQLGPKRILHHFVLSLHSFVHLTNSKPCTRLLPPKTTYFTRSVPKFPYTIPTSSDRMRYG